MTRLIDRIRARPAAAERAGFVNLYEAWKSGTEELETSFRSFVQDAYKRNGVVFACILARMMLLSEAEFKWRNRRDKEIFGNEQLGLLERPWRNGTTGELVARMEQDGSLAGNAYIYRAMPDKLQRLRPDWMSIVSNEQEVIGYVYEVPGNKPSQKFLTWEEVAHWAPIPDPEANFRGMSWLQPVATEILADKEMTRHKRQFLQNAATPNMLVKVEGRLDPEVKESIREELSRRYEGVENAYKTMLLEGGADATVVGRDLRQLEFSLTQAAGENRIAVAANVPAIVVGLKEGLQAATYSNYGQAMRRFADMTGRPLWRSLAASLESILAVPGGAQLWYDLTDVAALRQDEGEQATIESTKAATVRSYIDSGFEPQSAVDAVRTGDMTKLVHTGKVSVQLYDPEDEIGNPNVNDDVEEVGSDGEDETD